MGLVECLLEHLARGCFFFRVVLIVRLLDLWWQNEVLNLRLFIFIASHTLQTLLVKKLKTLQKLLQSLLVSLRFIWFRWQNFKSRFMQNVIMLIWLHFLEEECLQLQKGLQSDLGKRWLLRVKVWGRLQVKQLKAWRLYLKLLNRFQS